MQKDSETKKELITDLESLFQVVLTVSIFFITFIDIFFSYAQVSQAQIGVTLLKWSNMPVAFVVCYIFFRVFRKRYCKQVLNATNILLLVELVLIVIVLTIVLVNGNNIYSYGVNYTLIGSLWGVITVPTITVVILLGGIFFKEKVT